MVRTLPVTSSSEIHLLHLSKRFRTGRRGLVAALDDANLWIRRGETLSVVGPTGCGKSTLLRVIAGLEQPDSGSVTFDGEGVDELSPSQRGIGLVFQSYALYPHFKVHGNIAFYFRLRRWTAIDIDDKVQETSRVMGIGFDKLLGRLPRTLSGGEKQRVALARCLSHSPRVLLLDEPFSNLDAALRQKTRGEVKKLVDRFGLTTIFVTHDQTEAVTMGHRIAVMQQGRIEQVGTYQELYREPLNMFVAGFLGSPPMNFFPARRQGTCLRLEISSQPLDLPLPDSLQHRISPNESVTIGARPEHLHPTSSAAANALPCVVEMVELSMSDAMQTLLLRHGQNNLYAKVDMQQPVRSGETLWCQFPPQYLYYFDREGKRFGP